MSQNPIDREDMESLLAVRQEMGSGMEPALVDSFAEKIIAEVRRQTEAEHAMEGRRAAGSGLQLALGIVSMALATPLTAIALGTGNAWMAVVSWIGIVLVNVAFAMRDRRDH